MLFEDNLGFISFNFGNLDNKQVNITTDSNGFARGTMFDSLYDPYKNYRCHQIVPNNKQEELLLEIMKLSFAITDIGLYLDLHPDNKDLLEKFKTLVEKSCEKEMEYVKNYGPLELIDSSSSVQKFNWINNPWPWENTGGTKYV